LPEADEDVVSDVDDEDMVSDLNEDPLQVDQDIESDPAGIADAPDDSKSIFLKHTGELDLWKFDNTDWALELQGHQDSVSCLAFSTDGSLLATGSLDGLFNQLK
ncbi:hypothetical protein MKX01_011704, partial [Papaver californicum]